MKGYAAIKDRRLYMCRHNIQSHRWMYSQQDGKKTLVQSFSSSPVAFVGTRCALLSRLASEIITVDKQ